jgi:hypothetical protein
LPIDCYREILNQADTFEINEGRNWYRNARARIAKIAALNDIPLENACGIVAVLSPQVEWSLNLRIAKRFIESKGKVRSAGFRVSYRKAWKCLKGDLSVIKGPKVYRFFQTLLNPDFPEPVIDSQMLGAYWAGNTERRDIIRFMSSERNLSKVREDIETLAKEKGEKVSAVQAIIWLTFKRLNSQYAGQLKLWR